MFEADEVALAKWPALSPEEEKAPFTQQLADERWYDLMRALESEVLEKHGVAEEERKAYTGRAGPATWKIKAVTCRANKGRPAQTDEGRAWRWLEGTLQGLERAYAQEPAEPSSYQEVACATQLQANCAEKSHKLKAVG